jgi:hypothetical protein
MNHYLPADGRGEVDGLARAKLIGRCAQAKPEPLKIKKVPAHVGPVSFLEFTGGIRRGIARLSN